MKRILSILMLACFAAACMEYGPVESECFDVDIAASRSLIVLNEGNYMYGNASLSFYDPAVRSVENEVFVRANGFKLGDVAQSAEYYGGLVWTVVCNSGVVFALDPSTFTEVKRITGFTAPRFIKFISPTKAYVTQLWDPRIYIVNPETCTITGYIETDMDYDTGSTEQMVLCGGFMYVNCWSMQHTVLKVDTATDRIVAQLEVGAQPQSMALDCHGGLWVLCDDVLGVSPMLQRINLDTFSVEKTFPLDAGSVSRSLAVNAAGDMLYWINGGIWMMDVGAEALPSAPFIEPARARFYALSVDPDTGDIYASDSKDYVQNGEVLRYNASGILQDRFTVGINPGGFLWRVER